MLTCPIPTYAPEASGSRQQRLQHIAVDVGEPVVASLELEGELGVVDSQAMEDRRLEIVDMDRVLHHVVAEVIGLAVADPGTDAAS